MKIEDQTFDKATERFSKVVNNLTAEAEKFTELYANKEELFQNNFNCIAEQLRIRPLAIVEIAALALTNAMQERLKIKQ